MPQMVLQTPVISATRSWSGLKVDVSACSGLCQSLKMKERAQIKLPSQSVPDGNTIIYSRGNSTSSKKNFSRNPLFVSYFRGGRILTQPIWNAKLK